jgi:hypothetical protein
MFSTSHPFTRALLIGVLAVLVLTSAASAGDEFVRPTFGLSASLQGSQLDILAPIWATSQFVVVPSFGITSVSDAVTDLRLGIALRHLFRTGTACPYAGIRGGALILTPKHGDQRATDYVLGAMAGGEYFFDRHFSVGVEAQLNASFSNENSLRFNNPDGTNVNTATAAMVTFYF